MFSFEVLKAPEMVISIEPIVKTTPKPDDPIAIKEESPAERRRTRSRACVFCYADISESSVFFCAACNVTVYCSVGCLNNDWNRGLHPALCGGAVAPATLPAPLRHYRALLLELGPHARQIVSVGCQRRDYVFNDTQFLLTRSQGFFLIDKRVDSRDKRMFCWVAQTDLHASASVAGIAKLNTERIGDMLQNYCPLLDFIIVLRTALMVTMHKVAIQDVAHNPKEKLCCCRACIVSGSWNQLLRP